jgi:hypothetical protein
MKDELVSVMGCIILPIITHRFFRNPYFVPAIKKAA